MHVNEPMSIYNSNHSFLNPCAIDVLTTHQRLQKANRLQELCFQCITSTQLLFDVSEKYDSHIPQWFLGKRCYKHIRGPDTAPEARASRKLVAATDPLQSFESCAVRKDTHAKSWHQCGQKRHTHATLNCAHTKASKFLRSADRGDTWKYCGQSGTTAVRKDTQAKLQILCGQKRHECKTTRAVRKVTQANLQASAVRRDTHMQGSNGSMV